MNNNTYHAREKGVILFISLIILLMITVVAIGSTRLSTTGQRISFNFQVKNTTFQTADGGLVDAKNQLQNSPISNDFSFSTTSTDPQTQLSVDTSVSVIKSQILDGSSLSVSAPKNFAYRIISSSEITDLNIITELEEGYLKPEVANN